MNTNTISLKEANLPAIKDLAAVTVEYLEKPQVDCPILHKFSPGHYIRELHMPAGTFAIGHYQNFDHLNIVLKGKVIVLNDDGSTSEITAPCTFVGRPGQKVGLVVEDTVWQNVYETDCQDVELLEAHFLTKSDDFLRQQAEKFAHASVAAEQDRIDYREAIADLGYTEAEVTEMVLYEGDMVTLPPMDYKVNIALSPIHGHGIFATANISTGEIIGSARLGNYRTPLGRWTNHSKNPNAEMVEDGHSGFMLVATKDIKGMTGGQPGEEVTIDYRVTRRLVELEGK